jgi:hypothetical protein
MTKKVSERFKLTLPLNPDQEKEKIATLANWIKQ